MKRRNDMKKIMAICMILVLLVCLVSCTTEDTTIKASSNSNVEFWTDEETGVQYIIYDSAVGYCGMGGITPRYNADGTLYTVGNNK
jgi:hypothetical protein